MGPCLFCYVMYSTQSQSTVACRSVSGPPLPLFGRQKNQEWPRLARLKGYQWGYAWNMEAILLIKLKHWPVTDREAFSYLVASWEGVDSPLKLHCNVLPTKISWQSTWKLSQRVQLPPCWRIISSSASMLSIQFASSTIIRQSFLNFFASAQTDLEILDHCYLDYHTISYQLSLAFP